jgi:hypothetical protein
MARSGWKEIIAPRLANRSTRRQCFLLRRVMSEKHNDLMHRETRSTLDRTLEQTQIDTNLSLWE